MNSTALLSGLVGAGTVTAIHETARRNIPKAPRMDILGMRAIDRSLRALGQRPPPPDQLHNLALGGDIAANSLFYSLVGLSNPKHAPLTGAVLGLLAGIGGVLLPKPMGLGSDPSARTPATQAMTVAWYTAGGLAAGLAYRLLNER